MNVIQSIQDYINKMLSNISGMKVMLLDKETTGILSMVFSQSQILQKEVYLFEKIEQKNRELMAHLKAVCFLRPTAENFQLLQQELKDPKYGEYHIFFSNTIKNTSYIEELAEADEHEIVQQLQEFFGDYYAVNPDLFSLNLDGVVSTSSSEWKSQLDRSVDGISSCLLSLKKQPVIRYAAKSEMAQKCVVELQKKIAQEPGLYDFRKTDVPPLLLILDRRDDPVTPLLTPWSYQAMVHELLTIRNNIVDLKGVPGIRKELEQIVLSCEQDPYFKQTMYLNFGDLGIKVKELVDEYQRKTQSNQNIETVEDIKKFIENYPEFRKMSGNVSKHVSLMGELSRVVDNRALLDVSEVEQDLANRENHSEHIKKVKLALDDPRISNNDKVRMVILYALRYENHGSNETSNLVDKLSQLKIEKDKIALVSAMLKYAGSNVRGADVFMNKTFAKSIAKTLKRGIRGVENIYTEHRPLLKDTLDLLFQNKLKDIEYPYAPGSKTILTKPPQDIIIFIVGGVTYDEANIVHEYNAMNNGVRIALGGTAILNSQAFLKDVANLTH